MSKIQLQNLSLEPDFPGYPPIPSETALADGLEQVLIALLKQTNREKALEWATKLYKKDPELSLPLSGTLFHLSQQIAPNNLMKELLEKPLKAYKDANKDSKVKEIFKTLNDVFESEQSLAQLLDYDKHWKTATEVIRRRGDQKIGIWVEKQSKPVFEAAFWERLFVEEIANELARLGRRS